MASVSITINGRRYEIACDEGQEAQLSRLGRYVDDRVRQLSAAVGQLGDNRLLVMTCLLLADELSERNDELDAYKIENNSKVRERKDELIANKLDAITKRILSLSQTLEGDAIIAENLQELSEVQELFEDDEQET
jgi:cell division protein ZapA